MVEPAHEPVAPARPPHIRPEHLEKFAIVYLRQSTLAQVREHTGSTEDQRALARLPDHWGWPQHRILVLGDLGRSGTSIEHRTDFLKALDLIERGEASLFLARSVDRISRDTLDGVLFLKKACEARMLLYVNDRLYDMAEDNDSDLFMLHIETVLAASDNRRRVKTFRNAKLATVTEKRLAVTRPPLGYIRTTKGQWAKDPDPRVQETVRRVFELYLHLQGMKRVVHYFRDHGLEFPHRVRGTIVWSRDMAPAQVMSMLRNPNYTGDYVFQRVKTSQAGRHTLTRRPESEWKTVEGHHEPYLSHEEWRRVQDGLASRHRVAHAPRREGAGLLQGLMRCGTCDTWMNTVYWAKGRGTIRVPSYSCRRTNKAGDYVHDMQILARLIDQDVVNTVLTMLTPATVQAALAAIDRHHADEGALQRAHQLQLRAAKDKVVEAERLYREADRINRAVKARLETAWEQAVQEADELKRTLATTAPARPRKLRHDDAQELLGHIRDLRALWNHPTITHEDRKRLLGIVLSRIVVLASTPKGVELDLVWSGGRTQRLFIPRASGIDERVATLYEEGKRPPEIAEILNVAGQTDAYGKPFSAMSIYLKLTRLGLNKKAQKLKALRRIRDLLADRAPEPRILETLQADPLPGLAPWTARRLSRAIRTLVIGTTEIEPLPGEIIAELTTARTPGHEPVAAPAAAAKQGDG